MIDQKPDPLPARDPKERPKGPGRRRGPVSEHTAKDGLTDDVDPDSEDPGTAGSQ